MANQQSDYTGGWDLPPNFEMPSAREIELDLALGSDSWQSLLTGDDAAAAPATPRPIVDPPPRKRRAILRPAAA